MSVVAGYLGYNPSSTTLIVNRLVEKKLIKRASDPQDRRIVYCKLARGGRNALEGFDRKVRDRVMPVIDNWSYEQIEVAVGVMEFFQDPSAKQFWLTIIMRSILANRH